MTAAAFEVRGSNCVASPVRRDDQVLRLTRSGLVTTADRSHRMSGIRQRATKPELAVREALLSLGIRFRANPRNLPGRPDIANVAQKFAIFVHGCFWHRHRGCVRATTPARNAAFWKAKFDANIKRDRRAARQLASRGFTVLTIWECQTTESESLTDFLKSALTHVPGIRQPRKHTERFEVDKQGVIWRLVKRRATGQVVRTIAGPAGGRERKFTQEELRSLADEAFLRSQVRSAENPTVRATADEELRVLDVFGGCGAMSLGVAEACRATGRKFRAAGNLEIDGTALAVYSANFGGPQPRRDVGLLVSPRLAAPFTKREQALRREIGAVDMIVAGPPCQGHSNLNNETRRSDPRNELYFRLARLAKLFSPSSLIVENVPAVLHDHDDVVDRTARALRRLGYEVRMGIVNVADIGVAQSRRRHVLAAYRVARGRATHESPHEIPEIEQIVDRYRVARRDVRWAIADLRRSSRKGLLNKSASPTAITKRRINWLFNHRKYELANSQRPECHRDGSRHDGGEHRYVGVYGRMHWDKPGPTITGGYDTMGRGRFVHPSQRRTITPREAARLQFLPDWFELGAAGRSRSGLAQIIGNAVPPKLTFALALELIR